MDKYAPIALFVYNRLTTLEETVKCLLKNNEAKDSDLIIFSDGPKKGFEEGVNEVRKYLKSINGFKTISIVESNENMGLAKSIINGINKVLSDYDRIIVMEDDLITSPFFLKYMNDSLSVYENDEDVISIHGYNLPVKYDFPETYFLKGADCWGWATWRRGWKYFNENGLELLNTLKKRKLTREFDRLGSYPYTKMLKDQIKGKNNSWAIRWHASAFINDKYTLYPGKSLVNNIGFSDGTHCKINTDVYDTVINNEPIDVIKEKPVEIKFIVKKIASYNKYLRKSMIYDYLQSLFRKKR